MIYSKEYYKEIIKEKRNYISMLKSFLQSFIFGGLLCLVFNIIYMILRNYIDINNAKLLTSFLLIFITAFLTAFGIYDNIGQIAKCGLAIPISGFSNACISSAMEYKKEGLFLGIASNALKLAGAVIVMGTTSAFIAALIRYLFWVI